MTPIINGETGCYEFNKPGIPPASVLGRIVYQISDDQLTEATSSFIDLYLDREGAVTRFLKVIKEVRGQRV